MVTASLAPGEIIVLESTLIEAAKPTFQSVCSDAVNTKRPPSRDPISLLRCVGDLMSTVAVYRAHSEKCRELALMNGPTNTKILEAMAETWEKLADLRKRDRESEPELFGESLDNLFPF